MRILIIEDEAMARRSLEKLLENNFPDLTVVGECGSVKDSVAWLRDNPGKADIIFMDVELSDGECFEIFRKVDVDSHVVMTTAYDNYAVKAFEAGSVDYLLKPIDLGPLKRAVDRCRNSTAGLDVERILGALASRREEPEYKERFLVHFNDRIVPVRTDEIAYFFSEDKNNHVVTHSGSVYIVDNTMDSLMSGLDPSRFFKISRSCIFSKDAVESITKLMGGRLRVTPKAKISLDRGQSPDLTVSRSRSEEFLEWLEG
ncbi:MAG: response regulator transcription factor [Bacteroidales bacterium]|nr:response regulator transcription factor [Bacteroidales bacterium]